MLQPLLRSPVATYVFTYVPGESKSFSIMFSNQRRDAHLSHLTNYIRNKPYTIFQPTNMVVRYNENDGGGRIVEEKDLW